MGHRRFMHFDYSGRDVTENLMGHIYVTFYLISEDLKLSLELRHLLS